MPEKFWNITAQADSAANLEIYGEIGDDEFFGEDLYPVSSRRIQAELKELGDVKTINVHINSCGGGVFCAQAIYSMLKAHGAEIVVHVDGLAASSASVIAMAGNKIIVPENAIMMIHNPSTGIWGQSKDLRKRADTLDTIRDAMIAAYGRCNKTKDEIISMMDAETWMTGAEAVKAGFADSTEAAVPITASVKGDQLYFAAAGKKFSCERARYKKVPGIFVPAAQAEKGSEHMTLEELKAQHPELVAAIQNASAEAAQTAERSRIQAIDDFGAVAQTEDGMKAKFTTPISAEAFAVNVLKANAKKGSAVLANLEKDAGNLPKVPTGDPDKEDAAEAASIEAAMAAGLAEAK